ncbi:MAG: aspartyl protease family protein [Bacteroidales bacterium]|nr:aspartyl protease family protein [Bacteroidales bacterium]MDE7127348.1 aspartyl protease family protein [Bacteroidales bacterium]
MYPLVFSRAKRAISVLFLCLAAAQAYGQEHHFEYIGNHIYLEAEINGKPANLVFDTGAELIYLDSTFVADKGLTFKKVGNAVLDGAGTDGPSKTKIIFGEVSVCTGGKVYRPEYSPIINLKALLGEHADGIFGMKAISGKIISIDYRNRRFNLYDKLEPQMTDGYKCIPVSFQSRQILVPLKVTVNTQTIISGNALMDIGSGSGITLTSSAAHRHGLENIAEKTSFESGGMGGKSAGYTIAIENADIGGSPVDATQAQYSTDQSGSLASSLYIANIGNAVWSRFNIILDLPAGKMYLKRN